MKQGRSLQEVAAELERQKEAKRDFIADTRELMVLDRSAAQGSGPRVALKVNGHGEFGIDSNAHRQLAQRVGVPQKYYDRMADEAPGLLAMNLNHWLHEKPERRMVRTLDGNARAVLSDRYRCLDNFDLATVALETLGSLANDRGGMVVESSQVTTRRLYLKAFFPSIQAEVRKGDVLQAGVLLQNDECGGGRIKVLPMTKVLWCTNGAIHEVQGFRAFHVGKSVEGEEEAFEIFADETRKADDKAVWLKVRDTIKACASQAIFDQVLKNAKDATGQQIGSNVVKSVEVLQERFALQEGETAGILDHLIKGGDLTRWGMHQAITRYSQDVADYERATEFEALGGRVLTLPQTEWKAIAEPSAN